MLSSKTLKVYDILFRFTTFVKCVPFGWNNKNSILKMHPLRGRALWLAYLSCVLDELATLVTVAGLGSFILTNYHKLSRIIPGLVYVGTILFISSLKFSSYLYRDELIVIANKMLQSSNLVTRTFNVDLKKEHPDKLLEVSAQGLMVLTAGIPLIAFAYQLNDPMNLYLFYIGPSPVGQFGYALFSMVLLYNKICILNFMTLLMFAPGVVVRYWLQRIGEEAKNSSTRSMDEIYGLYNSVRVFATIHIGAFCPLILTLYLFGCSIMCIIGSSMLILFHEQLRAEVMVIIAEVIFFVVFGFMYGLQLQIDWILLSEDLLATLGVKGSVADADAATRDRDAGCEGEGDKKVRGKYWSLVRRSQKPIICNFSSMFNTSQLIILETFEMITEEIAELVIGFRGVVH